MPQERARSPHPPPNRSGTWGITLAILVTAAAAFFLLELREAGSQATPPGLEGHHGPNSLGGFAAYAGSASCRACHRTEFDRWLTSHHARAERGFVPALDHPAFDPPRSIRHGTQTSEVRHAADTLGEPTLITLGLDGARHAFSLTRVIGVDPLRQFLVAVPGGRFQAAELAFDPKRGEWFDVFGDEDRKPGEWGHWTGRGMTWNAMCAACHNTALRKNYRAPTDTYATTMAEPGVGCEACHGPMATHVAWQQHRSRVSPDSTLHRLDRDQVLDTCGSCHARRAELTGDFVPRDRFFDHYSLVIPDETDVFYADGQVHAEDYEFTSFLGSRMYAAGVRCVDCHEPHTGKTRAGGDTLCLRCHQGQMPIAPKIDPAAHSHHSLDKPGGTCTDCHMPQTVYMERHARHDHGFTIPDPLLTRQRGIPNACNRCHTDRNAAWALAAVEKWYGSRMDRPTRARAQAIAQARLGQVTADANLLSLLRGEKIGLWRAVAAELLGRWVAKTNVARALAESASDSDPLVRVMVVRALEPLVRANDAAAHDTVAGRLEDPVRAVRVEAAWAMRATLDTNSPAGADLRRFLEFNLDEPNGAMQQGVFDLDRGDRAQALVWFRRAVSWDGASAPLRQALAVTLSLGDDTNGAVRELEAACRLTPRDAECRFKLGLALNEAGRLDEAVGALEQAVRLEPRFAQAWYNLGLGYSAQQKPERALDALERAESIDARSPQIPYARATVLARLGRLREARVAAQRALELAPGFSAAKNLLGALDEQERSGTR